jgi:hypothetical protein
MKPLRTPDGHYLVVRGRLWRASDPNLPAEVRAKLVRDLMRARRKVKESLRSSNAKRLAAARAWVDAAKIALGERGQSTEDGQAHVAPSSDEDRKRRIATAAYLRSERRGFLPGAELEDWLEAEKDEDSKRTSTK